MTGGAFTDRAREFLSRVPVEVLDKPFSTASLRELVRRRLGVEVGRRGDTGMRRSPTLH